MSIQWESDDTGDQLGLAQKHDWSRTLAYTIAMLVIVLTVWAFVSEL